MNGPLGVLGAAVVALAALLNHWTHQGIEDGDRDRRMVWRWLSIPIGAAGVAALVVAIATS